MAVFVVGLSHQTAPVVVREKFAFPESEIHDVIDRMKNSGLVEEAVVLSTCNRVEVYAGSEDGGQQAQTSLKKFLIENRGYRQPVTTELYSFGGRQCIEHLFKVASGLDSMVLGETEILGQLKRAYHLALRHRHTGGRLNKAFQKAFNVAKQVRSQTQIQRGATSVASVAVELAEKIFDSLIDRQVMVVGAGETSEKTARALLSRGAHSVIVSNRSYPRAVELARELEGLAIRFEQWDRQFAEIDIVISSTSAPHYLLDRKRLQELIQRRHDRPLLLVDIAVPRDIDPEVNLLDNVYLYNVDDLQAIADNYVNQRREEITRCEQIIRGRATELMERSFPTAVGRPSSSILGNEA